MSSIESSLPTISLPPKLSLARKPRKQLDTNNPISDNNSSTINVNDSKKEKNEKNEKFPVAINIEKASSTPTQEPKKNKIGTYASTEFQNWLNTPIQKPKIKRSKKTNDDAFQIFIDFAEKIESEEWKTFFNKLYTGKFPHGYSYRNQTLFFRKRTKIEKLDIQDSSNETMNKVMNFFKNYGGFSNIGEDTNIFDFLVSKTPVYKNWKDIRSKKTKQFFIIKYVDELTEKHQLNVSERKSLLDTIHTGFLLKSIESCDIEFDNQKINNIKTIRWNPNNRKFDLDLINRIQKPTRKSTADKVAKSSFLVHWTKFLQQIVNRNQPDEIPTDVSIASVCTDDLTDNTTISVNSFTDS